MSKSVTVEVDLADFEDEEIFREAMSRRFNFGADKIAELAAAIERGDKQEAHRHLHALISDTPSFVHAAEIARFRFRPTPNQEKRAA